MTGIVMGPQARLRHNRGWKGRCLAAAVIALLMMMLSSHPTRPVTWVLGFVAFLLGWAILEVQART